MNQNNNSPEQGSRISLTFRQLLILIVIGALIVLVSTGVVTIEKLMGLIK